MCRLWKEARKPEMSKARPEATGINHLAIHHNQEQPAEPAKEQVWEDRRWTQNVKMSMFEEKNIKSSLLVIAI
jgi:hypothetical protein